MEDMIKALVSIDQKARETVQSAKEKRAEAKAKIAQEKAELYDSYIKRAQSHIDKMKEQAEAEDARQQLAIEEGFRESAAGMERQFQENKERWTQEIVCRCKQV